MSKSTKSWKMNFSMAIWSNRRSKTGSSLGSGAIMVFDDSVSILDAALNVAEFYSHESCGQCTPCREGSDWVRKLLKKFVDGKGTQRDWDLLWSVSDNMDGTTICALAEALVWPTQSYLKKFESEFRAAMVSEAGATA